MPADVPDWQSALSTYTTIFPATSIASGGNSGSIDVTAYQSFILGFPTGISANNGLALTITDADNALPNMLYEITTPPDGLGNAPRSSSFNVKSSHIKIINNTPGQAVTVAIYASTARQPKDIVTQSVLGIDENTAISPIAVGINAMGYLGGSGLAFAAFNVSGTTIKGFFRIQTDTTTMEVADTSEMIAGPSGAQRIYKELILPTNLTLIEFVGTVGGAGTAVARIIYQGE